MQELAFEQVDIVVGGEGADSCDNASVETDTIKVKVDATGNTCSAANMVQNAYIGVGAMAGGIILGATTWGLGGYVGSFGGGMAGAAAWEASKDDVISALCN
jgi:hypothetical protein